MRRMETHNTKLMLLVTVTSTQHGFGHTPRPRESVQGMFTNQIYLVFTNFRSWSSQLRIMERHPKYKFGASQAQQYEWMKQLYPSLYKEIKTSVSKGQWDLLGGTWVEMDCNIPSGESLIRQFLFGQAFFKKEFGQTCLDFWLPDTVITHFYEF